MDKRVFVLSPKRNRCLVVLVSVLCAAFAGIGLWMFWLDRSVIWWWWPLGVQMFICVWLVLVSPQADKLEVSDEGLFLARRRGVGYLLRWDAITSVRIHTHSDAARLWLAVIEDSYGRVVKIPRPCQDSAEIMAILKQRLPESAFQTW